MAKKHNRKLKQDMSDIDNKLEDNLKQRQAENLKGLNYQQQNQRAFPELA